MYDRAQEIINTELPQITACYPSYMLAMREDLGGYYMLYHQFPPYHRMYRIGVHEPWEGQ